MLDPRPAVWRLCAAVAAAACLLVVAPGGARADSAPLITSGPVISGTPQVGGQLTASATWTGDPAPSVTWSWLRCARPTGACAAIPGAGSATYTVVGADVNFVLRVRVAVKNSAGSADARSAPTAAVPLPAVPTPTPSPAPAPSPTATSTPTATPLPSPTPSPSPAAAPQVKASGPPPLLDPFPVVRIKGTFTATGARITLLAVTAPHGARASVSCRGRDCPRRRYRPAAGSARLRPFERALRAGTRLVIAVTQPGFVGKYTVIVIRRHAVPWRSDRCLVPGASHAVRCAGL